MISFRCLNYSISTLTCQDVILKMTYKIIKYYLSRFYIYILCVSHPHMKKIKRHMFPHSQDI